MPFPSAGDLPDPGIEPRSPAFQEDNLTSEPPGNQGKESFKHTPLAKLIPFLLYFLSMKYTSLNWCLEFQNPAPKLPSVSLEVHQQLISSVSIYTVL